MNGAIAHKRHRRLRRFQGGAIRRRDREKDVARLLAATLCLEAASVWQFWWVAPLEARLHLREHFAVNVAVAGGLLLLQDLGGGRYTVDEWLKKAS